MTDDEVKAYLAGEEVNGRQNRPQRRDEVLPRVLPAAWREVEGTGDGRAFVDTTSRLVVIASAALERDGRVWLHVSASGRGRLPTWREMVEVKELFCGAERTALQKFPPRAEWVNRHPFVLHLFACLDGDVTPDFRLEPGML